MEELFLSQQKKTVLRYELSILSKQVVCCLHGPFKWNIFWESQKVVKAKLFLLDCVQNFSITIRSVLIRVGTTEGVVTSGIPTLADLGM